MANQLTPNNPLIQEIRELVKNARTSVAQQVNTQLLSTYWQIGRAIVEYEQQSQHRAEYGNCLLYTSQRGNEAPKKKRRGDMSL